MRILVVGLGRTGESVVRYLQRANATIEVADEHLDTARQAEFTKKFSDIPVHTCFSESLFAQFDLLVVSPGVPLMHESLRAAREHGVRIAGDIELFAAQCKASLIAVTGSNGKSTVVEWLGCVLGASDRKAVVAGNIGTPVLDVLDVAADIVVLELSSFQLELLDELATVSAVVLNVSEDHMDRYDSFTDYAAAKRRIHRGCQHIVVNACDRETWPAGDATVVSASFASADNDYDAARVVHCSVGRHEQCDWLKAGDEPVMPASDIQLAGAHNIENALAVIALLMPLDLPVSVLKQGLVSFGGLPHRTQLVSSTRGVTWVNDSKGTNVDACAKAVAGMGAPVILIAGGLAKGADFSVLREPVTEYVKALILIGKDAQMIEDVLGDLVSVHHACTMREAVEKAAVLADSGDVVLLSPACASFDMFDSFEHRGDVFCLEVGRLAA